MGIEQRKSRVKGNIAEQIREEGGVSNIHNPVHQVFKPVVGEAVPSKTSRIVSHLRKTEKVNQLPARMPEKPTLENVGERLYFEELMVAARDRYEKLTGEKVELNLSGGGDD